MRPGAVKSRSGLQRMPPLVGWSTIEELHDSRVERIFGARDEEPIVLGELLENIRSVSQVVCGSTNVVPNASKNECERLLACGQLRAACLPRERVAAPNIGTCEATVPVSQTFECFSG